MWLYTKQHQLNNMNSLTALVYHTSWEIFRESFGIIHSLLSGCVGVEVSAHVLDLQLQIQLGALPGALSQTHTHTHTKLETLGDNPVSPVSQSEALLLRHHLTLKAICSKKCAVPLFLSFS